MTDYQPPLFDSEESRRARDEAMQRASDHASTEWKDAAMATIYQVACQRALFASDDIWAAGLERPREPRALGPVLLRAVRDGYIVPTGSYAPSSSVAQHARPLRVYRSRIYGSTNPAAAPVGARTGLRPGG